MKPHRHFLWTDLFRKRETIQDSLVSVLRDNVLFRTLTDRELRFLSTLVYERVYEASEPVFNQNDRGYGMYLIARGAVSIKSTGPGGEVLVTTLGAGSFFGELALIEEDNLRSAAATALERTVLIGLFKPDLVQIVSRKPGMGVKILLQLSAVLGQRLLATTDQLAEATGRPETAAVAAERGKNEPAA